MHRGLLIILNPSRPHCCSLPQVLGLHWGRHRPASEWERISSIFASPATACLHRHPPCVERHGPQAISCEVHISLFHQPDLAPCNGLTVPRLHPDKAWMGLQVLSIRSHTKIQPFYFVISDQNRGLLVVQMAARRLIGRKQHRHCPKRTKISNMSAVQHADPGCSE